LEPGREKAPKFGKELAVPAPIMARAASETAITADRFEATRGAASGGLSACVSLSSASATCVPYVSARALAHPNAVQIMALYG